MYMTVQSISMAFQKFFPSDPIILHSLVSGYEMLSRAQPLTNYIIHYKSMKITFEPQALITKFYKKNNNNHNSQALKANPYIIISS